MTDRKTGKHGTYLDLYPDSGYDPTVFERPTLTVDTAIFRVHEGRLQVLMIERGQAPFKGLPAFPGGYVDIKNLEDSDSAAHRELEEETGIPQGTVSLKQFKCYANGRRDPRWYTTDIVYYCLLSPSQATSIRTAEGQSDDAAQNFWLDAWGLLSTDATLAFDHLKILGELLDHLAERAWGRDVVLTLGADRGSAFTLGDMHTAYQSVTRSPINFSNFCKLFRNRYPVVAEAVGTTGKSGRPPRLYRLAAAE